MKHQCTKTLAGLMAMLFCLMALSGCGTGGSEQSGSDTTADTGTETTLTEVKNSMLRPGMFYQNPLTDSAADPMIIEHDGTYYLYSTGNKTLSVRTSKNLLSWTSQSEPIFSVTDTTWAVKYLWAPEVHEYNGKFYLFFENQFGVTLLTDDKKKTIANAVNAVGGTAYIPSDIIGSVQEDVGGIREPIDDLLEMDETVTTQEP